jgi:hypothetical protein
MTTLQHVASGDPVQSVLLEEEVEGLLAQGLAL